MAIDPYQDFLVQPVDASWLQCNIECQEACPVGTNCRGYLNLAAEGRFEEGYILSREPNPVAAMCSYVCSAPCERACRRGDIDRPLAIRAMKRFLVEWHEASGIPDAMPHIEARAERIAIVGAGPAGMSVARELAMKGFQCTVFDSLPYAGGTMLIGVPAFRLPREAIEMDMRLIERLGVEFVFNTAIGQDITFEQLQKDYDSVAITAGAMNAVVLDVPGAELEGVQYGVDFMKKANLGEPLEVGRDVVVIGGGYTAMDCSRTSLRHGAANVAIVYRRTRSELVVDEEELGETEREGVRLEFLASPVEVLGEDGHVVGVKFIRNRLGEPDASGRRSPVPIPGSEFVIKADTVIPAVSQAADLTFLPVEGDFEVNRGRIKVDPATYATNVRGVFACGDFVTGPTTLIEAAGHGKKCAYAIDRYLTGRTDVSVAANVKITSSWRHEMPELYDVLPRQHIPMAPLQLRMPSTDPEVNFTAPVELGYDATEAVFAQHLDGAGEELQANALALRLAQLLFVYDELRTGSAVDDRDVGRPVPQGRPRAVHGGVAAADDDDVPADLQWFAQVRLLHEVHAVLDTLELSARHIQDDGIHRACRDRDRVVVLLQLLEGDVLTDRRVEHEFDAQALDQTHVHLDRFAGQPERRDTDQHRAAGVGQAVEDRALEALHRELPGDRHAGRSRANDRDALSAGFDVRHRIRDAGRFVPLDEEPFHRADGERPIDVAPPAGPLARRRADVGAHCRHGIRLPRQDVALFEPALRGEIQVAAAIGADGTRFLALDVALQPRRVDGLHEEVLVGVDRHVAECLSVVRTWGAGGTNGLGVTGSRENLHRSDEGLQKRGAAPHRTAGRDGSTGSPPASVIVPHGRAAAPAAARRRTARAARGDTGRRPNRVADFGSAARIGHLRRGPRRRLGRVADLGNAARMNGVLTSSVPSAANARTPRISPKIPERIALDMNPSHDRADIGRQSADWAGSSQPACSIIAGSTLSVRMRFMTGSTAAFEASATPATRAACPRTRPPGRS